jgi:tetratricopeptide (TPR) repeat protein
LLVGAGTAKRLWLALAVCGAFCAWQARGHAQEGSALDECEALIHTAMRHFDKGAYLEAHALFEGAHRIRPSADNLRAMGLASLELRRYARAAQELSAALLETHEPLTSEQRARVVDALKRAQRHVGSFAFELSPADASIYLGAERVDAPSLQLDPGAATVRVRADGYEDAVVQLIVGGGEHRTVVVTLKPTVATQLAREGTSALLLGQVARATELLRRAIEADPGHAPAYRSLGLVLERVGSTEDAIATYDRYLALDPNGALAGKIRERIAVLRR